MLLELLLRSNEKHCSYADYICTMSCWQHFVMSRPASVCPMMKKGIAKAFLPKLPPVSEAGIKHGQRAPAMILKYGGGEAPPKIVLISQEGR